MKIVVINCLSNFGIKKRNQRLNSKFVNQTTDIKIKHVKF